MPKLDPENERLESGLLFVRHFYARRNDTCLVLADIELAPPECRPPRLVQGELLLDDRHRRKANPISRRAGAKQDIDAPEPHVAPVHLEACRVGPHVKPHCPEIPDKQLPEFVGILRIDEWKLMQRPRTGTTEHFRGLCQRGYNSLAC
jgi:hypothetical protein